MGATARIWSGISSGLVVMSDVAVVYADYEEFEDLSETGWSVY